MTIIAYRNGIMAADTKITADYDFMGRSNKIVRLPHGHLLGVRGDADERDFVKLMGLVRSERSLPSRDALTALKQAIGGLLVLRNGRVYSIETFYDPDAPDSETAFTAQVLEVHERFAATGNGFRYALGAMSHGASAIEACEIACKWDTTCGLPVRSLRLKP